MPLTHKIHIEAEILGQHVETAVGEPDSVATAVATAISVADLVDLNPGDGKLELVSTIKTKIGAFPINLPIKLTIWSE